MMATEEGPLERCQSGGYCAELYACE